MEELVQVRAGKEPVTACHSPRYSRRQDFVGIMKEMSLKGGCVGG